MGQIRFPGSAVNKKNTKNQPNMMSKVTLTTGNRVSSCEFCIPKTLAFEGEVLREFGGQNPN
jgi:hypothetical protein